MYGKGELHMNKMKKGSHLFLATTMLFSTVLTTNLAGPTLTAQAAEGETIDFRTTLKDRTTKADRYTFDIWANDKATGVQIAKENLKVTQNGKDIGINWHDSEKTSYTLNLTAGVNTIVIEVNNGTDRIKKTFKITQEPAQNGDVIGDFVFSMDTFALGTGYLIEPQRIELVKGLNSAQILDKILTKNMYTYKHTGTLDSGFYLAHILKENDKILDKTSIKIPTVIKNAGDKMGIPVNPADYDNDKSLGEFDFSRGSGWMYSVNNIFPNVGFADNYPQHEDVMRTQFTLLYGSDLGGGMVGENVFEAFSKDEATRALAYINSSDERKEILKDPEVNEAYHALMDEIQIVNPKQRVLDTATGQLDGAVIEWAQENGTREQDYLEDYTPEQQQFLDNKSSYEQQVANLPEAAQMTNADFEAYRIFKEKLDEQLAPNEQKLLKNYAKLQAIDDKYKELSQDLPQALALQEKIKQLPKADYVQLMDAPLIQLLRSEYEALQPSSKKLVKNLYLLEEAEEKLAALQARQSLIEDIATLPTPEKIAQLNIVNDKAQYEQLNKKIDQLIATFDAIGYDEHTNHNLIFSEQQYKIYNYDRLFAAKTALLQLEHKRATELYKQIVELDIPLYQKAGQMKHIIGGYSKELITKVNKATALINQIPTSQLNVVSEYQLYPYGEDSIPSIKAIDNILKSDDFKAVQQWERDVDGSSNNADLFKQYFTFSSDQYEYIVDSEKVSQFLVKEFKKLSAGEQNELFGDIQKKVSPKNFKIGYRHLIANTIAFYDSKASNKDVIDPNIKQLASLPVIFMDEQFKGNENEDTMYDKFSFKDHIKYEKINYYYGQISSTQKKYFTEEAKVITEKLDEAIPEIKKQLVDYFNGNYKNDTMNYIDDWSMYYEESDDKNVKKYYTLWDVDALDNANTFFSAYKKAQEKYHNIPMFTYTIPRFGDVIFSPIDMVNLNGVNQERIKAMANYLNCVATLPAVEDVTLAAKQTILSTISDAENEYKQIKSMEYMRAVSGQHFKVTTIKQRLNDLEAVEPVQQLIEALPSKENLSLKDQTTYEQVQAAYDALTAQQQALVKNVAILKEAATLFKYIDAVNEVEEAIKALPNDSSLSDEAGILAVRKAYDALPETVKTFIVSYEKLMIAEAQLKSLKNIKAVNVLFAALPEVTALVEADQIRIKQAREAYNQLSDTEKEKILGYERLLSLEQALEDLDDSMDKVQQVQMLIGNLPAVEHVTIADKEQIVAARKAYDALTGTQQLRVTNLESLKRVEKRLNDLLDLPNIPGDGEDENDSEKPSQPSDVVAALTKQINQLPPIEAITIKDGLVIHALLKSYNTLSVEQQAQVPNAYQLLLAASIYEALQEQIDDTEVLSVTEKIATLPSTSLIDLNDELIINEAKASYMQLTSAQQAEVVNYATLVQAEQQLTQLRSTALAVKQTIASLPNAASIKEEHRVVIEKARQDYQALTTSQKRLVSNENVLTELEWQLAALQQGQIQTIIQKISQLPTVITLVNEDAIRTIRKQYDALTTTQQKFVTNYSALQSAEEQLNALTQVDETIAQVVVAMINDLPFIVQKEHQAAVQTARQMYNALTPSQKLYVSNLDTLERAEQSIEVLTEYDRKQASYVMDLIERLPILTYVLTTDETQIKEARTAYSQLTKVQQKYVRNYAQLVKVEAQLSLVKKREKALKVEDIQFSVPTIYTTTTTFKGKVTPGAKVVVYDGSKKIKAATVAKSGAYTVKIPRQKNGTKLKLIVFNEVGDKLIRKYVTVKESHIKGASLLKATTSHVKGKAPKNHKVHILKGTKKIATVKTTSKGTFNVKFAKQKRGTLLKVIVADVRGNKSITKTVIVR